MKHWLLLAVLFLSPAPNLWAADPAKECLGAKVHEATLRPSISELPEIHDLPLPADLIGAIHRHPIVEWARKKYPGGDLRVWAERHRERGSGEGVQTKFILKVLREVFPNLRIVDNEEVIALRKSRTRYFGLEIADTAERHPTKKIDHFPGNWVDSATGRARGDLDMPIIKPANGTASSIDRAQVRRTLGIGDQSRVVSLYTLFSRDREALNLVTEAVSPKIIFYSLSVGWIADWTFKAIAEWANQNGFIILNLTEIRKGDWDLSDKRSKYLVVNDTRGKMPFLHAAADLTLVHGPINMFESLTVGTPTVVYLPKENLEPLNPSYHPETFKKMLIVALQTGATKYLEDLENASIHLREAIKLDRNFTRPHLIRGVDGKTPVDRMLDHLQQAMEEQGL